MIDDYTILGLDISLRNIGIGLLRVSNGKKTLRSFNLETSYNWEYKITTFINEIKSYCPTYIVVEQDVIEERLPGYQIIEQDPAQIQTNDALSDRVDAVISIISGLLHKKVQKIHMSLARNILGLSRLKKNQTEHLKNIIGRQFCAKFSELLPEDKSNSLVKEFVYGKRAPNSTLDNEVDAMIQCLAFEKRYINKEFNERSLRSRLIIEDAASWAVSSSRLKRDPNYIPKSIWINKEI